jgi:fructose-bisphosphate aldolase/2-amino-3,7-dideoxy-D-threo-hept-6-ulosonate synthase
MNMGKELRMRRLFNPETKRTVVIAADHGICISPMKELNDLRRLVAQAVAGGADAMILAPGGARLAYQELAGSDTALIMRIDGSVTSIGPDPTNDMLISSVETAVRMGADGVVTVGTIGTARESQLSQKIGLVADACELWGLPQMSEIVPAEVMEYQFKDRAARQWPSDPTLVMYAARVGAELGADIFKGYYTGDPTSFRKVLDYCPVPYVLLSGPAADDNEGFLRFVKEAMVCGAAGVSVGRNVFTHPDPAAMTRALCRIVHENASVASVMKDLR